MRIPRTALILVAACVANLFWGGIPQVQSRAMADGKSALPRGADLILLDGKIWTGEPAASPGERTLPARTVQAVAILDGRFAYVGGNDEALRYAGPNTQVARLNGKLAVPGLIDDHAHFIQGGFQLLQIDLKNASSEEEFVRRIGEKSKTLAPGSWLLGGDWDEEAFPDAKLPTRWMIDPVTQDHPVFISRYDGHSVLVNSKALQLAGVTKQTPDPPGGVIVRDAKTGEPTGVLRDAAQDLVGRIVPRPTEAEMQEALQAALREAARVGITTVEDITTDSDGWNGSFTGEIQLLRRAEQEGWLTCRIYAITPIAHWQKLAQAGISRGMGSDYLKMGAVKAFADGSLGSATAWMFQPFDDAPNNRGLPMPILDPPQTMERMGGGADQAGIQIATHAIGDRAISEMLDIYAKIGGQNPAAHRFRIEHLQHVRPEDFARLGKLGVIASMQPYHCIDDGRWAERRIGRERAKTSYAWRSVLNAGARLAFGSDWPVAPLDPIPGIYAAVTRATLDGKHPEGWIPEQRLSVEEALRAYTLGSAYAAFQENEKGSIEPGKLGDVVVLSDDVFTIPPEKIRDVHVAMTIVGGKVVHKSE